MLMTGPNNWLSISGANPNAGDIKARFPASTCAGLMHGAENALVPAIKMSGNCFSTKTSVTLILDSM